MDSRGSVRAVNPPASALDQAVVDLRKHPLRFTRFCQQDPALLDHIEAVVTGRSGHRVARLVGDPGSGRGYCVEVVHHRLAARGRDAALRRLRLHRSEDLYRLDEEDARDAGSPPPGSLWDLARTALEGHEEQAPPSAGAEASRRAFLSDLLTLADRHEILTLLVEEADQTPHLLLRDLIRLTGETPGLALLLSTGGLDLLYELDADLPAISFHRRDEANSSPIRPTAGLAAARLLAEDDVRATPPDPGTAALPSSFLELLAACGPLAPCDLLARALGYDREGTDDLIDRIDEGWTAERDEPGLRLRDLQFSHPAFPEHAVYRVPPLFRSWVAETVPAALPTPLEDAIRTLEALLPPARYGTAILLLSLARHVHLEDLRDRCLRDLAWWAGPADLDDLTALVAEAVEEGRVHPQLVWRAVLTSEGRWSAARRRALVEAFRRQRSGVPDHQTGEVAYHSALILQALGRHGEALQEAEDAVDSLRQGNCHTALLAGALTLRGQLLARLGDPDRALTSLREALEVAGSGFTSRPLRLPIQESLAEVQLARGEHRAARRHAEVASHLAVEVFGEPSLALSEHLKRISRLHGKAGDRTRSREILERAAQIEMTLFGESSPRYADTLKLLSTDLEDDQPTEAARVQRRAVEVDERAFGQSSERTRIARSRLLDMLERSGDREALRLEILRALAADVKSKSDEDHRSFLLRRLADLEMDRGDADAAHHALEESLALEERRGDRPARIELLKMLGELASRQERPATARDHLESALRLEEEELGPHHPDLLDLLKTLADLHLSSNRPEVAVVLLERAADIEERTFGRGDPRTAGNLRYLVAVLHRLGRKRDALRYAERCPGEPGANYAAGSVR